MPIVLLTAAVALAHGCVAERLAGVLEAASAPAPPPRMAANFVHEMKLVAPVVTTAPRAVPRRSTAVARAAAPAASAPQELAPGAAEEAAAAVPPQPAETAAAPVSPEGEAPAPAGPEASTREASAADPSVSAATALAPAPAASAARNAPPFAWPDSTRMSYHLSGHHRGPVDGSAQVEWIQADKRYQLHLDVVIGASAAPLMSRRMSSQGRLTPNGLAPERYDEQTDRLFGQRRQVALRFEADAVVLANGERASGEEGVQDAVSQFVQLTFLLTTQPALLDPGSRIAMPVALPRRVAPWIYEVLDAEVLATPFGPLRTLHLQPRLADRRRGELTAQVWIAPELQYLPVRIRIEQDAETFIDLMIDRLPLIAAAPAGSRAAPTTPPQKATP